MNSGQVNLQVEEDSQGLRIDKYIFNQKEELSRSYIQKLMKDGMVLVDGKPIKSSYKVQTGNVVCFFVPEPENLNIKAENIPIDIIYEDNDIILVNKPKGMVVHPAAGHYNGTLVNALMYHCKEDLSGINGVLRPGIVHRIDMNTTGIIVVCKNDKAHNCIAAQLKEHSITRKYNAIVCGSFKSDSGTINAPIGRHPENRKKMCINEKSGRNAVTHYSVIENFGTQYAHIECTLETGRTHQIRVHMASIHHPLLGDDVYGSSKNSHKLVGQTLHARVLGFVHPTTNDYVEFEAPLPKYFTDLIEKFKNI